MSKKDYAKLPKASDIGYESKEKEFDDDAKSAYDERVKKFSAACDEFVARILGCLKTAIGRLNSTTPTVRVTELEELMESDEKIGDYPLHVLLYGYLFFLEEGSMTSWSMRRPFPPEIRAPFLRVQEDLFKYNGLYLTDCSNPRLGRKFIFQVSVLHPYPRERIFHGYNKMPGDPEPPLIPFGKKFRGALGSKGKGKADDDDEPIVKPLPVSKPSSAEKVKVSPVEKSAPEKSKVKVSTKSESLPEPVKAKKASVEDVPPKKPKKTSEEKPKKKKGDEDDAPLAKSTKRTTKKSS